jgi:predicted transcriptional regulator
MGDVLMRHSKLFYKTLDIIREKHTEHLRATSIQLELGIDYLQAQQLFEELAAAGVVSSYTDLKDPMVDNPTVNQSRVIEILEMMEVK